MARIPGYQGIRVNAPQEPLSTGAAKGEGLAALGRGLSDLGRGISIYENRKNNEALAAKEKRDSDEARVYTARMLASLRERMTVEETQLKETIGPGAEGYTPEYLKRYDGFVEEVLQGAPNDLARQALTERTAEIRGIFADQALTFEASASQMQREKDVLDGARKAANYLRTHPSEFRLILEEQVQGFNAVVDKLTPEEEERTFWSLKNGLATSAIEGELDIAPGVAERRLNSGYWDDFITPDQKNAFLKAAKSRKEGTSAIQQYQMGRMVENHLASIEETGLGIPGVSAGVVAAAYNNEVAGMKFADAERVAHKVHSARIEIGARQSPDERAQMLARYAPDRVNRPDTFAEDREVYERLQAALQQDVKLLGTDPAAWAAQGGEVDSIMRNSGTVNGINASLALQEKGGVPSFNARVLTKEQAVNHVSVLENALPSEKMALLSGFEQEYGPHFPKVMTELMTAGLSPDYMVIYNVQKTSPQVASLLAESVQLKTEDVQTRFKASGRGPWSTVETSVQGLFNPLEQASTYVHPQRRGQFNHINELYAKTAGNLVLSGRFKNPQDAAEFLFKNSFGGMHIGRTYYLPNETEEGTQIDTDRASAELERLLRTPEWTKKRGLETTVSAPLSSVGSARQTVDSQLLATRGLWANSQDGKSLELFIERRTGFSRVYETVPGPRGGKVKRPVTVSLEDVAQGRLRGGYKFPEERWTPPGIIESMGTPGLQ